MLRKRITVFTGHFGSGKTELAINAAIRTKQTHPHVALADLDVINPYFRSRDVSTMLKEKEIKLIAPPDRLAKADLPIVSGDIYRYLHDDHYHLIIDAGGDKDGATALGQYFNEWKEMDIDLLFVLNANRPYVSHKEGIISTIKQIESVSRLKVSGIINNSNTGSHTELTDIKTGNRLSELVSSELNIPYLYNTVSEKSFLNEVEDQHKTYLIQRFMKVPWE